MTEAVLDRAAGRPAALGRPAESTWTSFRTPTSLGTLVDTVPGTLLVVVIVVLDDDDDREFELLHAANVTPKTDAAARSRGAATCSFQLSTSPGRRR